MIMPLSLHVFTFLPPILLESTIPPPPLLIFRILPWLLLGFTVLPQFCFPHLVSSFFSFLFVSSFFFFFKNPNPWVLFINSEVTFRKFRSENFLHESCSSARRLKPVKFWEFSEFFWCLKMGLQLLYSSMAGEFLQIRFLHLFLISTTLVTVLASWNFLEIVLFTTYPKLRIIQPL